MHWTDAEILTVISYWGTEPETTTAARVDRTGSACRAMLKRELSSCSMVRGRYTVAGLADESGYDRASIRRALAALPSKVRRVVGPESRRWHSLSERQAEAALEWLAQEGAGRWRSARGLPVGSWAPRAGLDGCRACGTDGTAAGQRHAAHGLCRSCAGKAGRRGMGADLWVARWRLVRALARRG